VIKNTIANTWTAVVSNTTTSWNTIKTTITTTLETMKTSVTNAMAAIKKTFSDAFTDIANTVKTKMGEANTNMTSALNTMKTNVSTACSAIKTSVGSYLNMSSDAYVWGRDICISMANGINDNAWRVTNAARSLANSVDDILGFSVPEEGPLSHADEYMPDFMELLANGIKDSKRVLLNTIQDLAGTVGTAFTSLSLPEISGPQMALAGGGAAGGVTNNRTVNLGGLSVVVNGYEAKDDNDLADTIVHRINDMLNEDDSVWGK